MILMLPPPPESSLAKKQKEWDSPAVAKDAKMVVGAACDPIDWARLLAVAAPHASDWLNALSIASCGLRLDNKSIHVSIGLRLGLKICEPHECSCSEIVDK